MEALRAATLLEKEGISAEIIDLRSLRPLDEQTIIESVRKTGRLVVTDTGHRMFGASAELIALVAETSLHSLTSPPIRVTTPEHPAPTSPGRASCLRCRKRRPLTWQMIDNSGR